MDHPLARMPSLAATFLYSPPQRLRCSASHFSNPTPKLLQPTPLARDPLHHWKQTHSRIPSPFHLPHLSISNPPLCIAPANSYGRVPAPSHNTSGSRSKAEHLYLPHLSISNPSHNTALSQPLWQGTCSIQQNL